MESIYHLSSCRLRAIFISISCTLRTIWILCTTARHFDCVIQGPRVILERYRPRLFLTPFAFFISFFSSTHKAYIFTLSPTNLVMMILLFSFIRFQELFYLRAECHTRCRSSNRSCQIYLYILRYILWYIYIFYDSRFMISKHHHILYGIWGYQYRYT